MVLAPGIEPGTYWLQVSCSTNWATPANWWLSIILNLELHCVSPELQYARARVHSGYYILQIKSWQWPTFTWGNLTLSSALNCFTSEFGMGSGGSNRLWSPGKTVSNVWWGLYPLLTLAFSHKGKKLKNLPSPNNIYNERVYSLISRILQTSFW